MISLQPQFEKALKDIGIPSDRMELVKRNIQLKSSIKQLIKAFEIIADGWHFAFEHEGTFKDCSKDNCAGIRKIIEISNPD